MFSLRTKILTIGLVFLLVISAVVVLYSFSNTANYKRLRLEDIEKTVENETEKGNKIVLSIENSAVSLALSARLFYQTKSYDLAYTSIMEYLNGSPTAAGGGIWFEPYEFGDGLYRSGFYAHIDADTGVPRNDVFYFQDEYDYHSQNWYVEIHDALKQPYQVVWTKPYYDDSVLFSLLTTAGAGFFDEHGKLLAIATIDWDIEDIITELTKIKPTKNSFVLLSVPDKDYIITNTYGRGFIGMSLQALPWDISNSSFVLDGVKYLAFSKPMDNGWQLDVNIPENEIYSDFENQNNRFIMIFALSSMLMLYITYKLLSKLVNAPIKQLTTDVAQLAVGNLDVHIDVNTHDEIGIFAQAFNKMTGDLKDSIETNVREREEKERIITELSVAREIQASMLPRAFQPFPGRREFDLHALMNPAMEVGGDFYDFFMLDGVNLALVIADVSGKGVPAALFMVIAKTLIKSNALSDKSPREVFRIVNATLCENNDTFMFVTAFMGYYNTKTGSLVYVNAGHNPPLVKRRGGAYEDMKTNPCKILGFTVDAEYHEETIALTPGDILFMYTDGVTEAMDMSHSMFSVQRLRTVLNANAGNDPEALLSDVKQAVEAYTIDVEQHDDITMLALRVNSLTAAAAAVGEGDDLSTRFMQYRDSVKELTVRADLAHLAAVIDFVNTELEKAGCPPHVLSEIDVSVEEIFTNIANYAYEPYVGETVVRLHTGGEAVVMFSDEGRPYNPLERDGPDLERPLVERDIGGLGIYIVKRLMDKVQYARVDDKNVLVMSRKLT